MFATETDAQTKAITALFQKSDSYDRVHADSMLHYAKEALALSRKFGRKVWQGTSLHKMGSALATLGRQEEAQEKHREAAAIFRAAGEIKRLAYVEMDMGKLYHQAGDYPGALQNFRAGLASFESIGDSVGLAMTYDRLGLAYGDLQQYDKAVDYYHRSLALTRELNHRLGMSVILNNLAANFREMKQPDSALYYIKAALAVKEELKDSLGITRALTNLGLTYTMKGQLDSAEHYLFLSLKMSTERKRPLEQLSCYGSLCELFLAKEQPVRAIAYGEAARELLDSTQNAHLEIYLYKMLSKAYATQGKYALALDLLTQHMVLSDSLVPSDLAGKMIEKEVRMEVEKQQIEIELLEAREDLNLARIEFQERQKWWFGLLLVLTVLMGLGLYSRYRIKVRTHAQLQQLDEAKSRYFANLSHEFRTPLTLIIGPLEQLVAENGADPAQPHYQRILHNARRLLTLNEQLLELAKIESGSLKVQAQEGDVVSYLRGNAEAFRVMAEQKQIELHVDCPEGEKVIGFDADKLEKVVNNLLANALQYTPAQGVIRFRVRVSEHLQLEVSDTGAGISPEDQSRIFDRYSRLDLPAEQQVPGAGIGLSLVRDLVGMMGGTIVLDSQPGVGSTFKVTLPFLPVQAVKPVVAQAKPELLPAASTVGSGELPLVLIVDDHAEIRAFVREQMEGNFRVLEAEDGRAGVEVALAEMPDLIVSDLMMPELDGLELCRQLKSDERSSHIPIILLTALDTVESRIEGLETGADDYLAKPFHARELLARSQNLMAQVRRLQERFRRRLREEDAPVIDLPTREQVFFKKVEAYIATHLADPALSVERIGEELAMSRVQLFRKLKAITGQTPSQLIRAMRLHKAAGLLGADACNVAEAMYAAGYDNASYFAKIFRAEYGCAPKEYRRKMLRSG